MKQLKLGGWHRLWIVLTAIYTIIFLFFAYNEYPQNIPQMDEKLHGVGKYQKEIILAMEGGYSEDEIKDYLKEKVNTNNSNKTLEFGIDAFEDFDLSPIDAEVETAKLIFSKQKAQKIRKQQQNKYLINAIIIWFIPIVSIYILGFCIGWIYRGFKSTNDANG